MKAIDGYFLIKPDDLAWRPSNIMRFRTRTVASSLYSGGGSRAPARDGLSLARLASSDLSPSSDGALDPPSRVKMVDATLGPFPRTSGSFASWPFEMRVLASFGRFCHPPHRMRCTLPSTAPDHTEFSCRKRRDNPPSSR